MPHIVRQPPDTGVMKLLSDGESQRAARLGPKKWRKVRHEIDYIDIDGKRFRTPEAINRWLRRRTKKGAALTAGAQHDE